RLITADEDIGIDRAPSIVFLSSSSRSFISTELAFLPSSRAVHRGASYSPAPQGAPASCASSGAELPHVGRDPSRSVSRVSTSDGTSPDTSPPNRATSLTRLDARNDHSGLV